MAGWLNIKRIFPPLASTIVGLGLAGWYGYAERRGLLPEEAFLVCSTILLLYGCGWLVVAGYRKRQQISSSRLCTTLRVSADLVAAIVGGLAVAALAGIVLGGIYLHSGGVPSAIRGVTANIEMMADIRGFPRSSETEDQRRLPNGSRLSSQANYLYRSLLVNLSKQRADWKSHVTVELEGSSCIQIERFTPTRLRILDAGSRQIKVDVFRIDRSIGAFPEAGGAWLTRENFDDYSREPADTDGWNRTGFFVVTADVGCTLEVAVLIDGNTIHQQRLRVDLDKATGELQLRSLF